MVKPLMFMRWCEYYKLSDRETDFISFFMMNFSAARSGNQPKIREQFIEIQKKPFLNTRLISPRKNWITPNLMD